MNGYWQSGSSGSGKVYLKGGYVGDSSAYTIGSIPANTKLSIVEMDAEGRHTPPATSQDVYFTYMPYGEDFIICMVGSFSMVKYSGRGNNYFNGNEIIPEQAPKLANGTYDLVAGYYCKKTTPILLNAYEPPDEAAKLAISSCVTGISAMKATPSTRAAAVREAESKGVIMKMNTRYVSIGLPSTLNASRAVLQDGAWGGYFYFKDWVAEQGGEFVNLEFAPTIYCEWQPNTTNTVRFRAQLRPSPPKVTIGGVEYDNVAYPIFGEYDIGKDGPEGRPFYNTNCQVEIEGTTYKLSVAAPSCSSEFYPGGPAAAGCHFRTDNPYCGVWARLTFIDP